MLPRGECKDEDLGESPEVSRLSGDEGIRWRPWVPGRRRKRFRAAGDDFETVKREDDKSRRLI